MMPSTAFSIDASENTIAGALPPSSRCTRLTSFAAERATAIPARTDPVIATICGVGCSTSATPVSRSPRTTLSVPAGVCRATISASSSVVSGVDSAGFSTTVFPAASAGAIFHTAIFSG